MDDRELLSQFITDSSAEAFAQLVRRNADMVYSSALRQLNDEHLADDVTQAVFMLLWRKAKSVKHTVAGWLLYATTYACKDARKLASRRQFHERQAGSLRGIQATPSEPHAWETYAPQIDAAISRLAAKHRDAVTLRFFRGMSLRDVGTSLGITEEAARKRVGRGVSRLREILSAKTAVPACAILTEQLATRATIAAPANVLSSALAAPSTALPMPTLIAKKVAGSLLLEKLKIAAILLLALGVTGGAAGSFFKILNQNPAVTPSSPPPPIRLIDNPVAPSEATIPGEVQLAHWEAILDDRGAAALTTILRPVPTQSKVFRAMLGNGAKLRSFILAARQTREVTNLPNILNFAEESGVRKISFAFIKTNYFDNPDSSVFYAGTENEADFTRDSQNQLRVSINYLDLQISPMTVAGNWTWAGPSNLATVSLCYDGELTAGDAVAFLGDFTGKNGKTFHHLLVWETFKAQPNQMNYFQQHSATWWCSHGPGQLRTWADAALAWKAKATHPASQVSPAWERKLDDGKTVRLIGLSQKPIRPFCWWDADGGPIDWLTNYDALKGDPPNQLLAAVEITGSDQEADIADPVHAQNTQNSSEPPAPYDEFVCLPIKPSSSNLEVGILVGPWTDAAHLSLNHPVSVEGENYRVEKHWKNPPGVFNAQLTFTAGRDHADLFAAVDQAGSDHFAENLPSAGSLALFEKNRIPKTAKDMAIFRLNPEDVAYFRLLQRRRQWVTFPNIALQPH